MQMIMITFKEQRRKKNTDIGGIYKIIYNSKTYLNHFYI